MPVTDRLLAKYTNVPAPLAVGVAGVINGAVRLPARAEGLTALVSSAANPLVPLITTGVLLQGLALTVSNHPTMLPSRAIATLVQVNQLSPNSLVGLRDIVVGFAPLSNFLHIQDPTFNKLLTAIRTVLAEPAHTAGLTAVIQGRAFDAFRTLVRRVEERYLADAMRVMARFHGTAHFAQLTELSMPAWAKVFYYAPPAGMVSASITFNAALLEDHVRKHLCFQEVNGQLSPEPLEPVHWIDFLDCRDRITVNWLRSFEDISDQQEDEIFDGAGYLRNTLAAKQAFVDVLRESDEMIDDYRTTLRIERDYQAVAIRTLRRGRKFIHYTNGGQIFITGSLNGVYSMARYVPELGEFAISTAYLPSHVDLLAKLAQWAATTVWDLA